jgi:NADPH2:quinone reductase
MSSGVNPSDVKKRMGSAPGLLDSGPVIPHSDGAGVIEAVGEGVSPARVGERAWVYQAQHGRRFGTAAEYVTLESRRAPPLPGNTDFEVGACIGIPIMTAHRCVFADGPVAGISVVVTGGAGRVGHYAIQWAKQAGARVIATASNPVDTEACLQAGAQAVVNHRDPDWGKQLLAANGGKKVDRVIDVEFGTNLSSDIDILRTSGTIVTYGSARMPEPVMPFYRMMFQDLLIRLVIVYDMPEEAKEAAIQDINKALEQGRLVHRMTRVDGLNQVVKSHELVEQGGFRGCVVLSV